MRVNVYAEELSQDVELVTKEVDGQTFTGVRFYLYLPVTRTYDPGGRGDVHEEVRGKFMHGPDDDDSAAVTFWGKRELRGVLKQALGLLDDHFSAEERQQVEADEAQRAERQKPAGS